MQTQQESYSVIESEHNSAAATREDPPEDPPEVLGTAPAATGAAKEVDVPSEGRIRGVDEATPTAIWDVEKTWPYHSYAEFDNANPRFVTCGICLAAGNGKHVVEMRAPFQIYAFTRHTEYNYHARAKHTYELLKEAKQKKKKYPKQASLKMFFNKRKTPSGEEEAAAGPEKRRAVVTLSNKVSCEGAIPRADIFKDRLKTFLLYRNLSAMSYDIRRSSDERIQVYSKNCSDHAIMRRKGTARCCDECFEFRSKKWADKSKLLTKSAKKLDNCVEALKKQTLGDYDVEILNGVVKTDDSWLSLSGKVLKARCKATLDFVNVTKKEIKGIQTRQLLSGDSASIAAPNKFLEKFIELYKTNATFRDSLVVLLLEAIVAKTTGHKNVPCAKKVMDFYVALQALSPKSSQFVRANCPGPCIRTLQRKVPDYESGSSFVACDKDSVMERLRQRLLEYKRDDGKCLSLSVAIDATAVSPVTEMSYKHSAIMGFAHPNHLIKLPKETTKEAIKEFLEPSDDRELALEIKTVCISIQDVPALQVPFFGLCGRPQTKNEQSSFNQDVMDWLGPDNDSYKVLSVAVDGVSSDKDFAFKNLLKYLRGELSWTPQTDANHNMKNWRYQLLGGAMIANIGKFVIDCDLLRVASVSKDLWRISD